jgi:hypothetical protein
MHQPFPPYDPTCHMCTGDKDPRNVLRAVCPYHFGTLVPLTEAQIKKALDEGREAYNAMMDNLPTMPGFYR